MLKLVNLVSMFSIQYLLRNISQPHIKSLFQMDGRTVASRRIPEAVITTVLEDELGNNNMIIKRACIDWLGAKY